MLTENDQQQAEVILPLNCLKKASLYTLQTTLTGKRKHFQVLDQRGGSRSFKKIGERVVRLADWLNTPIFVKSIIVYGKRKSNPGCTPVDFCHESLKVLVILKKIPAIFCGRM